MLIMIVHEVESKFMSKCFATVGLLILFLFTQNGSSNEVHGGRNRDAVKVKTRKTIQFFLKTEFQSNNFYDILCLILDSIFI